MKSNNLVLWDNDLCYTCIHRHNQKQWSCKSMPNNPCRYKKQRETMIGVVVCEKCGCIIDLCRCKQPNFIKRMV